MFRTSVSYSFAADKAGPCTKKNVFAVEIRSFGPSHSLIFTLTHNLDAKRCQFQFQRVVKRVVERVFFVQRRGFPSALRMNLTDPPHFFHRLASQTNQ